MAQKENIAFLQEELIPNIQKEYDDIKDLIQDNIGFIDTSKPLIENINYCKKVVELYQDLKKYNSTKNFLENWKNDLLDNIE